MEKMTEQQANMIIEKLTNIEELLRRLPLAIASCVVIEQKNEWLCKMRNQRYVNPAEEGWFMFRE